MFEELRKYPIDPDQPRRRRILQAALTPEEYAFLERLAKTEGKSVSMLTRDLLRRGLNRYDARTG